MDAQIGVILLFLHITEDICFCRGTIISMAPLNIILLAESDTDLFFTVM